MKKVISLYLLVVLGLVIGAVAVAQDTATKDECVDMCKKAAQLVVDKGIDEAVKQVNDKDGPFVWKDSYVYIVHIETHQVVAHPLKPALIGKDLSGLKDISGKMFFVEITNLGASKGEGWVEYMWPKPGEKKPVPKLSYVYRAGQTPYVMCAGIYK